MFKNLVQFYAMAICFLSAIILIVTIPLMVMDVANLCCAKSRSEVWEFNSNASYLIRKKKFAGDEIVKEVNSWTPAQVTEKREAERDVYIAEYKHNQTNSLFSSFIWFVIAGLFFCVHWWLYKKEGKK